MAGAEPWRLFVWVLGVSEPVPEGAGCWQLPAPSAVGSPGWPVSALPAGGGVTGFLLRVRDAFPAQGGRPQRGRLLGAGASNLFHDVSISLVFQWRLQE